MIKQLLSKLRPKSATEKRTAARRAASAARKAEVADKLERYAAANGITVDDARMLIAHRMRPPTPAAGPAPAVLEARRAVLESERDAHLAAAKSALGRMRLLMWRSVNGIPSSGSIVNAGHEQRTLTADEQRDFDEAQAARLAALAAVSSIDEQLASMK